MFKPSQSSHWYDIDAKPHHDADLRVARKEHLLPSVTSIISILSKPALDSWKQTQAVMAALTLPKVEGESEKEYCNRIVTDAKAHSLEAMGFGTKVHNFISEYLTTGFYAIEDNDKKQIFENIVNWIQNYVILEGNISEKTLADLKFGFAGTIDFIGNLRIAPQSEDRNFVVADFKTQNVKDDSPVFYPEYIWQLAAYRRAFIDNNCLGNEIHPEKILLCSIVIDSNTGKIYTKTYDYADSDYAERTFLQIALLFKLIKKLV